MRFFCLSYPTRAGALHTPVPAIVMFTILEVLDQFLFKKSPSYLLMEADSYCIRDILTAKIPADPHSCLHRAHHDATLLTFLDMLLDFNTARLLNLSIEELADLA